jgi:ferredoxin
MKVVVDYKKCQGHGRCYDLAPDVFEPDARGHVDLAVVGELPPSLEPDTLIGVNNCPEAALRLIPDSALIARERVQSARVNPSILG